MTSAQQFFAVLRQTYDQPGRSDAAQYFHKLSSANAEQVLGSDFCKLATAFRRDPWELGQEVVNHLEVWLEKQGSANPDGDLASFYVDWASNLEKTAISLAGIGAGAQKLWSGVKGTASAAASKLKAPKPLSPEHLSFKNQLKASRAARGGVVHQAPIPAPMENGVARVMNPAGHAGPAGTTSVPAAKYTGRKATKMAPKPAAAEAKPEFKDKSNFVHKAIGTGVLGVGGLAAMNMMGGGNQGGY